MSIILDWLFPRRCFGCGRFGFYLCPSCSSRLVHCSVKPDFPKGFSGTLSLFHYRGSIKYIINDLKFKFVSDEIPELATLVATGLKNDYAHLLQYWQQQNFTLIPVPLHPARARWRGFNQSELLASSLASIINLNCSTEILSRCRYSPPQSLVKNKTLRHQNVNSAFCLNPDTVPPSKIILIDDVATTGSTLSSALSVFPKSTEAWALTIAG